MRRHLAFAAAAVLVLAVTVAWPERMVQPGPLSAGHRAGDGSCLTCHTPFRQPSSTGCVRCHRPKEIGRRTVAGAPLPGGTESRTAFHGRLGTTDCAACHTLHASLRPQPPRPFRHELLAAADRAACASCHDARKPRDPLHSSLRVSCSACHSTRGWRPATFDHRTAGADCAACHLRDRPGDALHQAAGVSCASCHRTERWRPATFDHARYFRFDGNHPADCRTCHTDPGSYSRYSCYGCHEHTPARVEAEHREEGIRDFQDCARCHRSGSEGEAEGHGGEERGGEDDD